MNMKITFNGADVTNDLDLQSCILTDRYGGLLDDIRLVINDTEEKWANYGIVKGDEIIIKTDGYTTGSMYVSKAMINKGKLLLDAVSLKPSKKIIKSRIWHHVRLSEILNDCAKENGLELKTYGITDYYYDSLAQIQKTDIAFASEICIKEGYSVKVDNNCLIVFNEKYMESLDAEMTIRAEDVNSNYSFVLSSECTNNVTVSYYDIEKGLLIEQTATDDNIIGDSKIIIEKVSSFDEANRYAYGHLRNCNKKAIIGRLSMPYNSNISAGTVFNAEGFQEFDDKYVVIEVSHDIKLEISNLTVRKVIAY